MGAIFAKDPNAFLQPLAYLALPLILSYNGRQGSRLFWFFYLFYPVHLLALALIKHFIMAI